jgi:hypothetical protein
MSDATDQSDRATTFVERVEDELGYEVDYAPDLGEELGWFCLEVRMEAEGEEFLGDLDFELSQSGVDPLYAEITVGLNDHERRAILSAIGERLEGAQNVETYQYDPAEGEFGPLVADLHEIHEDVFGA